MTRVAVIGAGVGGLSAAISLASAGLRATVFERAESVGGKVRVALVGDLPVDVGPTVLTMRWVFDELFARAGQSLEAHVRLEKLTTLARHAWSGGRRLDLFADQDLSRRAIADAFGDREAEGFERFCRDTARMYATVEGPFLRAQRPTFGSLLKDAGSLGLGGLARIDAHRSMASALARYFRTPELRQLFGRYATYTGSSPFEAPATLNLIAHVEGQGVWRVAGGMAALARALEDVARGLGVEFVLGADILSIDAPSGRVVGVVARDGARFPADIAIVNADVSALSGMLGGSSKAPRATPPRQRSLSAVTWASAGSVSGAPLAYHNVFFSDDDAAEFDALFTQRRVPDAPTVYVCAQDRDDGLDAGGVQRLFTIINAPATGDEPARWSATELRRCEEATSRTLDRAGLSIRAQASHPTTPCDFEARFPKTGGALYGPAARGMLSSFSREGARTKIGGLYLAGGSVHPGPGLPMVSLSGQLAARAVKEDLASIARSRTVAMSGSTSTG